MPATPAYSYRIGQEPASMAFEWLDRDGAGDRLLDRLDVRRQDRRRRRPGHHPGHRHRPGITGAATSPNVTIDWATDAPTRLVPAEAGSVFVVHLIATRTADSEGP